MDILYCTHNRLEFTRASVETMLRNTDWSIASRVVCYDDRSTDGTLEYLRSVRWPVPVDIRPGEWAGPCYAMVDYLRRDFGEGYFVKVDNDVLLPPWWLRDVYGAAQETGYQLIGLEAFRPVHPGPLRRNVDPSRFIGGIGLFRFDAFQNSVPRPSERFQGLTIWQETTKPKCGWLNPALPVALLDRLPREPWMSLARSYVERKWSRAWAPYDESSRDLWSWWCR